jgi:hypothetical protein
VVNFVPVLKKELKNIIHGNDSSQNDYRSMLLSSLKFCIQNFQEVAEDAVQFLSDYYLTQQKLDEASTKAIADIIYDLMERYPMI